VIPSPFHLIVERRRIGCDTRTWARWRDAMVSCIFMLSIITLLFIAGLALGFEFEIANSLNRNLATISP
jgi:hypothetical protein